MFGSIQWRIAVPFALLILASMGILGFYLVDFVRDTQINDLRSQLEDEARLIAEASLPSFLVPERQVLLEDLANTLGMQIEARVTIIARDGTVLGDSGKDPLTMENHADRPEVIDALASGSGQSTRYSTTLGQQMMYVAVPIISQGGVIGIARVALPLTTIENSVNSVVMTIVLAMTITTALAILAAVLIARTTTRPIREITKAARRIASGELDQRIDVPADDESGQLAYAFNEMSLNLKMMVATISEERSKLASILSSMADGIIMTGPDRSIVLANRAAERLFNFEETKAVGRPLIEVVRDHEIDEMVKSCLGAAEEKTAQLESMAAKRFLRVISVPMTSGGLNGALVLFQDLSELRSLQTMRREFVGNISHELRTPLATIKAIVETLEDSAIDDKKAARDFLTKIDSEVERMTQLVAELTELSRIETGKEQLKLEAVDINSVVDAVIRRLSPQGQRQKVTLLKEPSVGLPPVTADKERIQQVMANLVHNAVKFTPSGGRVILSTELAKDSVVVKVSDTGTGISQEDLPHVFERFYKADKARSGGGTGLGLAIAKHIVQAHGGNIWVESKEGRGSTFGFSLPLRK